MTSELHESVEHAYLVLTDIYHSAKIQNLSDAQIQVIINRTIDQQKLQIPHVTSTELALFAQLDYNKTSVKFSNNTKAELVAARVLKIEKLELIEKNLWSSAGSSDLDAKEKAHIYTALANVVLKEKDLEDELVRLLD